jgi:hypothetical protein
MNSPSIVVKVHALRNGIARLKLGFHEIDLLFLVFLHHQLNWPKSLSSDWCHVMAHERRIVSPTASVCPDSQSSNLILTQGAKSQFKTRDPNFHLHQA